MKTDETIVMKILSVEEIYKKKDYLKDRID